MNIIYRISSGGYKKEKPEYATKQNCLLNALSRFPLSSHEWLVIADGLKPDLYDFVEGLELPTKYVQVGHGAGTFCMAMEEAMRKEDDEIVYFLEDDYLHQEQSEKALNQAFDLPVDYATLYDHPDKYLKKENGGNPLCEKGAELSYCFKTEACWWKTTNSTTMTFAARAKTLKQDWPLIQPYVNERHPHDFPMWLQLKRRGRLLISPMPSYSTHCETAWLADDKFSMEWKRLVADD